MHQYSELKGKVLLIVQVYDVPIHGHSCGVYKPNAPAVTSTVSVQTLAVMVSVHAPACTSAIHDRPGLFLLLNS